MNHCVPISVWKPDSLVYQIGSVAPDAIRKNVKTFRNSIIFLLLQRTKLQNVRLHFNGCFYEPLYPNMWKSNSLVYKICSVAPDAIHKNVKTFRNSIIFLLFQRTSTKLLNVRVHFNGCFFEPLYSNIRVEVQQSCLLDQQRRP